MKITVKDQSVLAPKIRLLGLLGPLVLALLLLAFVFGQFAHPTQASGNATTHYVSASGDCYGASPCYAVIQDAVTAAVPGDEIRVAAGTYTGVRNTPSLSSGGFTATQLIAITETLILRGGYTPTDWTMSDPVAHPTILDAQGLGRVVVISGTITPTVAGFYITGGNATGLGGPFNQPGWCSPANDPQEGGGGIFIIRAAATIQDNYIYNNIGTTTAGLNGGAGGILLNCSSAIVKDNVISGNVGTTADSRGYGGGIFAEGRGWASSTVAPIIANNVISGNIAGGAYSYGGGIHVGEYINARITGNLIARNIASTAQQWGQGGGISLLVGSIPAVIIDANVIVSNRANQNNGAAGYGGGIAVQWVDEFTMTNNIVAENEANSAGSGFYLYNMQSQATDAYLINNTISANEGSGDGVYFFAGTFISGDPYVGTLNLVNNIIAEQATALRVSTSEGISATIAAGHTLWDGNGTYKSVSGSGSEILTTDDLVGDPAFVGGSDYHITPVSAALDAGIDAGLDQDIDGQIRPAGPGTDIGADELWPMLSINYDSGAPGSYFTVSAINFPPNSQAIIKANGFELGTLQTDPGGTLIFLLSTTEADEGQYLVTVEVNPQASVSYVVDADAPLRPQEGTGTIFTIPAGLASGESVYLPMLTKP